MSHISKTTWVLENVLDKLTYNTNGCQLSCRDSTYRIVVLIQLIHDKMENFYAV